MEIDHRRAEVKEIRLADDPRQDYLEHARVLRKQGVRYQIHGWQEESPQAIEKWLAASNKVLEKLSENGRSGIDLRYALNALADLQGKRAPFFIFDGDDDDGLPVPPHSEEQDLTTRTIDQLVACLQKLG